MVNEDRVRIMTRLAVFEKEHGKEIETASRFYKSDYITYRMIWTGIMTTLAFALCVGLYLAMNFEYYMENMHKMNLVGEGKIVIVLYLAVMVLMLAISFFLYRRRYRDAQKDVEEYCRRLHELERNYNSEKRKEEIKRRQEER